MEEQCGGTVEQCWWTTHSGTVKQRWWNSVVQKWNGVRGIVEQCSLNSGTVRGEQCGGSVEE